MIRKLILTASFAVLSFAGFAADLVGTWNVRNYYYLPKERSESVNLMFGILGGASSIQFKSDGTFFCNDTVSGTYQSKGEELVLVRDKEQVEAFKQKLDKVREEVGGQSDEDFIKGYACDSLRLTFTKEGNKALVECNQNKELLELLPISMIFELTKKDTNGKNENLNAGKTFLGKYSVNAMGMVSINFDFKKNGLVDIEESLFGKTTKKATGKYVIKGDNLILYEGGKEYMKGEYVIGKNCLYLMVEKDGSIVAMVLWKK
ncbi:MAG: hypothetical protein KBT32_00080 [Bacteroidales bacterium]|nr:hypothetical protein [Candidatus Physcocola equi]